MKHAISISFVIASCVALNSNAADDSHVLLSQQNGDASLSKIVVDTATGTVSAMSILGLSSDQTSVVENPKGLSLAINGLLDGKSSFGVSVTPARTSFIPLNISDYNKSALARLWGSTSFSYAQGNAAVNNQSFNRRAFSIETSYFFAPEKDDPLVMYWKQLESAATSADPKNSCLLMSSPEKPSGDSTGVVAEDTKLNEAISKQAQLCRDSVAKMARWNASRIWASLATGHYQPENGGDSHTLGKTSVLGLTWGIDSKGASTASAITLAAKRVVDAPTLQSFGSANPTIQSSTLVTARAAIGSETIRAIFEGSNVKNEAPTAADRAYKRAIGIDARVSEDIWLNLRYGIQRRIDNTGDENGSSLTLSYSPKALLNL